MTGALVGQRHAIECWITIKTSHAAGSGWSSDFGDSQAALVGSPFINAVSAELYRLSGSPYVAGGGTRAAELAGA